MSKRRVLLLVCLALAALTLSGCASSMMQKSQPLTYDTRSEKALVTFMRPSYFGGAIQFGIWDSENFVGVLSAGSSIQYLANPGKHVFLARAENWSYVKADLQAGKQYFIIGRVFPGVWKARVALDPVNTGDEDEKNLADWQNKLTVTSVIPEKFNDYVSQRVAQVKAAAAKIDDGSVKFGTLSKEEGR